MGEDENLCGFLEKISHFDMHMLVSSHYRRSKHEKIEQMNDLFKL